MKCKSLLRTGLALAAVLVAAAASLSPARAELVVLESTAAGIKAGDRFADGDAIAIPAGSQVRVVLASGKTQTVKGPYKGTPADLSKGQPSNEGVMAWLKEFLKTGGARESTPGATRGIGPEAPKPPARFSWSAIPVTASGSVCVEKGTGLQLVRAQTQQADRVTIVDAASSARGEAQWAAGSPTAAWPANLAPRPDAAYHLLVPGRPQRQITLRVLDRLPSDADVLTELHRLGCKQQFEAWVREKATPGKRGT